ncbi:MAG: cobalt-precorrin-5B (C(1))-methyltransferase [Hyphomicrobiales bacterium]|nr:cobalt-precorrin-5B (C(1))-methyltransferase [Hyphomicrobiales bacterium]MDE2017985.1 cobalt-precorrin-5B (C(1))-methyltransferase [Hyphomicrobiales bacterium]
MADDSAPLRRGWTTGSCATAAARAAFEALHCGRFPDPVEIALPSGARVAFALAMQERGGDFARAGVVKDAGDDPDVTHGALVVATVRKGAGGAGVTFAAGEGIGTVTRPGLPLAVGEPAINPVPRAMIARAIAEAALALEIGADAAVEIAIPGGAKIAERTLNARLGIIGGLSILGTTGIVTPYSCAAWIDTIHRGIDVARAMGLGHVAGATGRTSEEAVRALHGLPDPALIDMGDFVGGMMKYLRRAPVPKVTVAAGPGKMAKLAQGLLDLHSRRGEVDKEALAARASALGADAALAAGIAQANTAAEIFGLARAAALPLAEDVVRDARAVAARACGLEDVAVEAIMFDRDGALLARTDFAQASHFAPREGLNRRR